MQKASIGISWMSPKYKPKLQDFKIPISTFWAIYLSLEQGQKTPENIKLFFDNPDNIRHS